MPDAPTVVFIAGSGRSGSTLVERMLGGVPGFVNVGELIDLFRRVYEGDELCGCNQPFSQCDFWAEVGDRAFGGWSPKLVMETADLQAQVARQRHIPHLLSPYQRQAFKTSLNEYGKRYVHLYRAIAATAGARVVVDASKWPAQAVALSRSSLDLRVVHIVRDVRGVAWSMSKRDVVRPHARRDREVMFHQGIVAAASRWVLCQAEVDAVRLGGAPVTLLKYESLVKHARLEVERVLDLLDLAVPSRDLHHLGTHEAQLGASHGLSGNPSRFSAGVTPLKLDEEWRENMPRRSQALLGVMGVPQRVREIWLDRSRRPLDYVVEES